MSVFKNGKRTRLPHSDRQLTQYFLVSTQTQTETAMYQSNKDKTHTKRNKLTTTPLSKSQISKFGRTLSIGSPHWWRLKKEHIFFSKQ